MNTTRAQAKSMARALRSALAERDVDLSHSACLELVARQHGLSDWNTLSAKLAPPEDGAQLIVARPILRIFSMEKAMEFYVDFLGFEVDWTHQHTPDLPTYMQVSRSSVALHLTEHHGDASPGAHVHVEMRGIRAFHTELLGKHYRFSRPGLEEAPWGALTCQVPDPFGNRISFNEPL